MLAEGCAEQHVECPDHPDVFFQEMERPAGTSRREIQRFAAVVVGQLQEIDQGSLIGD